MNPYQTRRRQFETGGLLYRQPENDDIDPDAILEAGANDFFDSLGTYCVENGMTYAPAEDKPESNQRKASTDATSNEASGLSIDLKQADKDLDELFGED